jgi:hypothetical protein
MKTLRKLRKSYGSYENISLASFKIQVLNAFAAYSELWRQNRNQETETVQQLTVLMLRTHRVGGEQNSDLRTSRLCETEEHKKSFNFHQRFVA